MPEAVETKAYLAFIDAALETSEGRFLMRPNPAELVARQARIAAVYREDIQPKKMVAARYIVPSSDGHYLGGAFVLKEMRGRSLSAVVAAIGLYDAIARKEVVTKLNGKVIVEDGVPNAANVAALGKVGFSLAGGDELIELRGTEEDQHLLAYAEIVADKPVIRNRPIHLTAASFGKALTFLTRWRG
ncbi:MAG: hypothetical protein NXH97_22315 [Rhodobacteraceae bacterium]|nr:hypothetical protein [Paracoccaceae bacterium]